MKGVEINFDIVISVTFKAYAASTYLTRNWVVSLRNHIEARLRLSEFDNLVVKKLSRNCSADAYLYENAGQLHLGVIMFESSTTELTFATLTPTLTPIGAI